VVDFDTAPVAVALGSLEPITQTFTADNGRFTFTLDLTAAPDLAEWATTRLRPVVQEWYPRIVGLLPSEGWQPIDQVTLRFRTDMANCVISPRSRAGNGFEVVRWGLRTGTKCDFSEPVLYIKPGF
jgi:hypothetical protein